MSTNPKSIYNEFIRANLPVGITYDEVRAQYVTVNGKRFPTYLQAKWYLDYITKFGYSPFSLAELFAGGEQGVWYDPSDLSTLFQDTAGTTPVTTAGQTVALMLDKSQGLTLGPELVTNGAFDTDTDWTLGAGWSISDGVLQITSSSGTNSSYQNIGVLQGTQYLVEFDYVVTTGALVFELGSGANSKIFSGAQSGAYSTVVTPTGTDGDIRFVVVSGATVSVDNISVKELPGYHATQPTTAARPTYQTDGTLHWLEFDGVDDRLSTGNVDMSETSIFTFFAGIRSLDTGGTLNCAFTTSSDTGNYRFLALAPSNAAVHFSAFTRGTAVAEAGATAAGFAPPNTRVMTGVGDVSAGTSVLRLDGTQIATASGTGTAGNFRNVPYTIGAITSAGSIPFEGNIYGLIARGASSTEYETTSTESYLAEKTGVTL